MTKIIRLKPSVTVLWEQDWYSMSPRRRACLYTLRISARGKTWEINGESQPLFRCDPRQPISWLRDNGNTPHLTGRYLVGPSGVEMPITWREDDQVEYRLDYRATMEAIDDALATITHGVGADIASRYDGIADWVYWLWYVFPPHEAREWIRCGVHDAWYAAALRAAGG